MRRLLAVTALSLAAACSHHAASSSPTSSPDDAAPVKKEQPAARAEPREKAEPKEKPASAQPAPVHEGKQRGALAQIESRSGSKVVGTARFTAKAGGVVMRLVIAGATAGAHSVVIHEAGDCGGSNAEKAGGAFSGEGGAAFGDVQVDASGNGSLEVTVAGVTISGADSGIVGRSIVIHDREGDARASSPRLACGVIKAE